MKGVFIYNQLEFRLEVKGEDFCQGDSLECSLTVKNHSSTTQKVAKPRFALGLIDAKKVKDRAPDAFELQSTADSSPLELAPQEQKVVPWIFPLDRNCDISDKSSSLGFSYGIEGDASGTQMMPLTVKPHRHIQNVVSVFESPFQFAVKGMKSSEGWVAVKMKPPSARRLVLVEELVASFRFEEDALSLKYTFKVKAFDTSATEVNVKKKKTVVEQIIEPKNYLLTPTHLNQEVVEGKIEEALGVVASGI